MQITMTALTPTPMVSATNTTDCQWCKHLQCTSSIHHHKQCRERRTINLCDMPAAIKWQKETKKEIIAQVEDRKTNELCCTTVQALVGQSLQLESITITINLCEKGDKNKCGIRGPTIKLKNEAEN